MGWRKRLHGFWPGLLSNTTEIENIQVNKYFHFLLCFITPKEPEMGEEKVGD